VFSPLLSSWPFLLLYTTERSNGNKKIAVRKTKKETRKTVQADVNGKSNRYGTKKAEGCRKWEAIGCCFSKALQRALSHVQIGPFVCLAASMEDRRHTHAERSIAALPVR
jgi:hypothetical protein